MGKLSPNVTAALILGVCIIIAGWLTRQNRRYFMMKSDRGVFQLLDTNTGTLYSAHKQTGPLYRFEKDRWELQDVD